MQAFIVSMLGSEVQIPKPIFSFFLGAQELESLNINPNTSTPDPKPYSKPLSSIGRVDGFAGGFNQQKAKCFAALDLGF